MKKLLLCAALSVVAASSLVSCGGYKFKPALDKDTKCSIRVVGSYDNFEALEEQFDKFDEYYPNVTLSYTKPDNYEDTLATSLSGKDKPNIFFSQPKMIGNEKYADVVSHMEDLSDAKLNIDLGCIRPGLIKRDAQNKILMAPVFSRTYGALVNEDLFKKHNLKVPTTWEDLIKVCASFREKGVVSPMMGFTNGTKYVNEFTNVIAYPSFLATLSKNQEALALANSLDPSAGQYMRDALTAVKQVVDNKCIDFTESDKIEDNYKKMLLRFFEGDVPMLLCNGDTVSGTVKREKESEAYQQSKFSYSFYPVPLTAQGGYFIDSPSVELSVNKDCENLDMTNEFMRFLITDQALKEMATNKRLTTPTKTISFNSVYGPFAKIPTDRTISPEALGVNDNLVKQIRVASYKVGKGELTIDEAIAQYGTF